MGIGKCEGMIQDISPKHLACEYHEYRETLNDTVICISEGKILTGIDENGEVVLPKAGNLMGVSKEANMEILKLKFPVHYLFSIDEEHYVLWALEEKIEFDGFDYRKLSEIRSYEPKHRVLASATAWHLYNWYADNRFCGRCGKTLEHDHKLRMLRCECGNQVFPRISPAVIVGVIRGDEILVTKYAGREYKKYALIAGFTEIGETAEETVAREVMEEVGLKVKNIRYYKSQPWGFTGTLLLGYFCEVEGDSAIVMDEEELSMAKWIKRDELEEYTEGVSLTGEMMNVFRGNK
ncbi:MAG: NAD(+) diphosphatase [Lachnospiraceae bacterium]|nr:NAD(+) diphosphatase [Lachnospiraceae bacterium]